MRCEARGQDRDKGRDDRLCPTWMGGRAAEGAPLLREYGLKAHRGFESLPIRQFNEVSLRKYSVVWQTFDAVPLSVPRSVSYTYELRGAGVDDSAVETRPPRPLNDAQAGERDLQGRLSYPTPYESSARSIRVYRQNILTVRLWSLRLASPTQMERGMPRPSVRRERFTPHLTQMVGSVPQTTRSCAVGGPFVSLFAVLPGRSILVTYGAMPLRHCSQANKDNRPDEGGPPRWLKSMI